MNTRNYHGSGTKSSPGYITYCKLEIEFIEIQQTHIYSPLNPYKQLRAVGVRGLLFMYKNPVCLNVLISNKNDQ